MAMAEGGGDGDGWRWRCELGLDDRLGMGGRRWWLRFSLSAARVPVLVLVPLLCSQGRWTIKGGQWIACATLLSLGAASPVLQRGTCRMTCLQNRSEGTGDYYKASRFMSSQYSYLGGCNY